MRTIPVEELKEAPSQMLPKNRVLKSHDYGNDFQISFINCRYIEQLAVYQVGTWSYVNFGGHGSGKLKSKFCERQSTRS